MGQVNTGYTIQGAFPSTVGGTGTTRKYFPNVPGPSIGVSNLTPSSTNAKGQLNVLGSNKLNGQVFTIDVVGAVSIDPTISCPAITIDLQANTGTLASPTYTTIATTGAVTAGNFDGEPFRISANFSGDSISGQLQGTYSALFNGSLVNSTPKASTTLSGLNFVTEPVFGLVVGVTFSVSGTNNLAYLYQFTLSS
jgi:hypothetical protein